jgi:hypothetical protein
MEKQKRRYNSMDEVQVGDTVTLTLWTEPEMSACTPFSTCVVEKIADGLVTLARPYGRMDETGGTILIGVERFPIETSRFCDCVVHYLTGTKGGANNIQSVRS